MANLSAGTDPTPIYVLGHGEHELARLRTQARLIDPITQQFFRDAGLEPGMRVLDVGSGAGDVAFLAAEMVGATGEVVGTDRALTAVAEARAQAQARSLRTVSFIEGDPTGMAFAQPFDAVVGRYVLQFAPDPTTVLRQLARHVRPGGVLVFHELAWDGVRSFPPVLTYDRCCRWITETFGLLGTETQMGLKLHAAFIAAGLPAPSLRLEAVIGAGTGSTDAVHLVADLVRTLLPAIEQLGVATATEVGIETLAERTCREVIGSGSCIVGRSEIGAWSRVGAAAGTPSKGESAAQVRAEGA